MCLSAPARIVELKGKRAKVKQADHYHWIDLVLVDQKLKKGDYLLVYQGVAVEKISKVQAEEILSVAGGDDGKRKSQ